MKFPAGAGMLLCALTPLASAITYTVTSTGTSDTTDYNLLKTDLGKLKAGDTLIINGAFAGGITTSVNGTVTSPITIEAGSGGASVNNSNGTGEGIEVNTNYNIIQGITINGFQESFRTDAASYDVANDITTNNSAIESFKFKNTSQHWLVENCTVNNSGMEGYYVSDASQNWTGGVPDQSGYITFYHDINNVNYNDGFDFKEGGHDVRVIDCQTDWQNTVPGGNDEGDSGVYDRADNVQVLNYTVKNNGSTGNAVRSYTATVNGITYGSNASMYGLVANNIQGAFLGNVQSSTVLYTNYSMTNVAGGLLESGDNTPSYPASSTFAETTWTSAGGSFNEGEFLPINLFWDNSQSAVGDGVTWDYIQQNFDDVGINGDIPGMCFPGVAVTFSDSNNGHYAVTLGAVVSPGSVMVNNSAGNYTFSGTGSIAGSATLSKSGTGSLIISTANTYTGTTSITGGTLIVSNSAALGATVSGGAVTISSGATLDVGGSTTANTINFGQKLFTISGTGVGGNGAIINSGTVTQYAAFQNMALGANASVGGVSRFDIRSSPTTALNATLNLGGFTFTKSGTNQMSLVGTDITNGGAIVVSGGTFSLETVTTTAGIGTITYNSGTTAQFYNNSITDGGVTWPLTLKGNNNIGNSGSGAAVIPAALVLDGNVTFTPLNSGVAAPSSNFPLSLTGNITQSGGAFSITKNGVNTLTLSGSDSYTGGTTVNAGTLLLSSAGAFPVNTALTINTGGTAAVANHGSNAPYLLQLNSLSDGGLVDLSNNDMIVQGGNLTTLTTEIHQGYNNGTWNGAAGITSTTAATTTNTALGIELAGTLLSTFDGQPVSSSDVLVKYTYYGDADLSGTVTSSDYTLIDTGFNNQYTGWHNGDFNYDGVVNGNDYTLIDNAFNTQSGSLAVAAGAAQMIVSSSAQIVGNSSTSVPESSLMCAMAVAAMSQRRRRR